MTDNADASASSGDSPSQNGHFFVGLNVHLPCAILQGRSERAIISIARNVQS